MKNRKLRRLLKKSKGAKTVYGLSKVLEISPQAADYIVKKKDLQKDYIRLKKIADYLDVSIIDIIDSKKKK